MTDAMRLDVIPDAAERAAFYQAVSESPHTQALMYQAPYQQRRLQMYTDIFEKMTPFLGDVLELGCSDGKMTQRLSRCARHITAVDVSAHSIERAMSRQLGSVTWVCADAPLAVDRLAWGHKRFDLVVASEILEHLIDPKGLMMRLRELTDAVLASAPIHETPNPDAFSVEAYRNPRKAGDGTGHIWCFRPDTFRELFATVWWEKSIDGISMMVLGAP